MSAAFTPGPWQSKHDYTKEGACTIIANVDGEIHPDGTTSHTYDFICTCEDEFGEFTERAEANARLIRAAPDLLAACEAQEQLWQFVGDDARPEIKRVQQMRRDAIAKARGEQVSA